MPPCTLELNAESSDPIFVRHEFSPALQVERKISLCLRSEKTNWKLRSVEQTSAVKYDSAFGG